MAMNRGIIVFPLAFGDLTMKNCACGNLVARNARTCPQCGKRFTHPFVKAFTLLLVLAGLFALVMTAKAATPETATVYVYRYKSVQGSAYSPSVYCDEKQLARMENGKYFAVTVDAGKHVFRSNDEQSLVAIDAKPGESYYIRLEIAPGLWKGHGHLLLVAPEQGSAEVTSGKIKQMAR
jgi:hypothetical protein